MSVTLIDQLKLVASAYVEATGLKVSRVSTIVFGDGGKLGKIMEGSAGITTWRFEETLQWFSDNWPEGLVWPPEAMRFTKRVGAPPLQADPAADQHDENGAEPEPCT